jgi:biopolymer transport protein ExbD
MIDEILQHRKRRSVQELNIVPILDMLTTVIFFLLLSTSFLEYVKLTVPPSAVTFSKPESVPLATAPKIFLVSGNRSFRLILSWSGKKAGVLEREIATGDPLQTRKQLLLKSEELAQAFSKMNPSEKTVQLGLGSNVPFQHLVSVMDGLHSSLPDVVLISYREAEANVRANSP